MTDHLIPSLAWVTAAAVLAPFIASIVPGRLVPIIVAEIFLGVILGQSGLGVILPNDSLDVLGRLGFALLMFVSGIEIDLDILVRRAPASTRPGPGRPLAWSIGIVLGTFALSVAGALLIWSDTRPLPHILFLAVVLSTTSVGILVPTLKERGLTTVPFGQILLAVGILADFVTMLSVSVLAVWITGGSIVSGLLPLLFVLIVSGVGLAIVRAGRSSRLRAVAGRLDTPTGRVPLRAAFALVFALALLAETLGAELVLAAFLAGIIVGRLVPRGATLRGQIDALAYGFLIPMFFFSVGVGFDLPALVSSPATVGALPALLAVAYVNKIVPVIPLRRYFAWDEVLGGGLLLSARLSLIIAAAAIGLRIGVLDPALNSAMILLAVITSIVSPTLFNLVTRRLERSPVST